MHIHEYQAKHLLREHGVPTPQGRSVVSPEQTGAAFTEVAGSSAVVKAQIHAGGRGKAGGVVKVTSREDAEGAARKLLGSRLVTAQTGASGLPVNRLLVEEAIDVAREYYLSISLDRESGCPLFLLSARGGMDIEEVSLTDPEGIRRERGNPFTGLEPFQARKLFGALGLDHDLMPDTVRLFRSLAGMFVKLDCSLIELNPLALTAGGRLLAADAKVSFDDNALTLHPELENMRDTTQEDEREVEADRDDLSYVGLQGSVGCMVNGAGLAMATMDLLRLHGGEPANFLDVGGAATAEKVAAAFRILCADERVRSILVNIFGGIVRCDLIAEGILSALCEVDLDRPLVVRLEGNRAKEGRDALQTSGLSLIAADSLDDAACKAVAEAAP